MITLALNITNLNNSLQVGDLIYAVSTETQPGANDAEAATPNTGAPNIVGVLRRITIGAVDVVLDVDETVFFNTIIPIVGDFLMFSKYDQTDGDVVGYYAQANFINDSKEKAELFSIGSEIKISSK